MSVKDAAVREEVEIDQGKAAGDEGRSAVVFDGKQRPARLGASLQRNSGFSRRLSSAIRRSLRLGPKRSTTATTPLDALHKPLDIDGTKCFTKYGDIRIEQYVKAYGTIQDLKRLIQLARQASIKKFIRLNNWPTGHEIRADLWKELCRDRDFEANKQLYNHEVKAVLHTGVKVLQASFLSADGLVIHDYGLSDIGVTALHRLLVIIESAKPEITYVPVLYPLCALFLHYLSEEETFACLMHLMRSGNTFVQQSFTAANASPRTLLALVKKHKSAAYSMMKRRVGSSEETVLVRAVRDWPSWLFHHLPFDYAVRVVDCFVVEGHKMLLRVALAIIYIWSKKSKRHHVDMTSKSVEERADALATEFAETASNCPVSIQTLLDTAVGIRNLRGSTIKKYQEYFENEVRGDKKSVGGMHRVHSPPPTLYTSPFTSQIVSMEIATEIMAALPNRFQLETPKLLFRLSDDGSSFTQLWTKIDDAEQTLLGIQTSTGEVFGAYCSASWSERKDAHERTRSRYFGTGESFLWKVDNKTNKLTIYPWAGSQSGQRLIENCPQMFMAADEKCIVVGSGGGDAIAIRDELFKGISSPCATFASPALADDREFIISQLEVFDVRSGPT